jgi:hypothetical protein
MIGAAFTICVGFLFWIFVMIIRIWCGSTAARGEYHLFRAGKA